MPFSKSLVKLLFGLDEILSSAELPPKELPQELTFEKDSENDNLWMEMFVASFPSSASHEVAPQVLHGSDILLDDPLSHGKLDTDLPTARGEVVLRQDGACSATRERDGACSATKERDGTCSANEERDQGVWEMHQDYKQMQLVSMSELRSWMDECKNTIPMQPSQLQKLNQHMHDLNEIISFMELPRAELPPEHSCEKLSAFLTSMMEFRNDTVEWLLGIQRIVAAD